MKELPKVFVSPIAKKMANNKSLFYSRLLGDRRDSKDILKEIDKIFHSRDFVYKSKILLTTTTGTTEETIVGKTGTALLTMDNKSIPIHEIMDIKKIP